MTLRISSSQYVTANTFFSKIADLFCILIDWKQFDDLYMRSMRLSMKIKFDKYWGDPDKMNYLIFISYIMDLRDKLEYFQISLKTIYGEPVGCSLFIHIKDAIYELFEDYKTAYEASCPSNVINSRS